ncbi:MAG: hypothetical protein ABSA46_12290 [Thermodesulfovibrionales bacterium]|jgi:hypothetical protein
MKKGHKLHATGRKTINFLSAEPILIFMTSGVIGAYHEDVQISGNPVRKAFLGDAFPQQKSNTLPEVTQAAEMSVMSAKNHTTTGAFLVRKKANVTVLSRISIRPWR